MGGRPGKTRAGAEWVQQLAGGARPGLRIALVADAGDAREVMIDGVSGICRIAWVNRPEFEASRRRLRLAERCTVARSFPPRTRKACAGRSSTMPGATNSANGKHGQETWDMLQFALRLGSDPRALAMIDAAAGAGAEGVDRRSRHKDLQDPHQRQCRKPGAGISRRHGRAPWRHAAGSTGTRRRDDRDREDALWSRSAIEALKLRDAGPLGRIVVAVDRPPAAAGNPAAVVAGLDRTGRGVVLADCSVEGASPAGWAGAVVKAYRRFDADRIVAEVNQGGDMVQAVLKGIDAGLPVTSVRASRGKWLRANRLRRSTSRGGWCMPARFRRSRTRCAISGRTGCRRDARRTGWTRWSGR